jgi:hypothetical protein
VRFAGVCFLLICFLFRGLYSGGVVRVSKTGGSNWYKYIKKYVWDDEKTPYFIAVGKLNKKQADYELFAYVCFISILFSVFAIILAGAKSPYGQSYGATFYAFSVAISAFMLHLTKNIYPAIYCAFAPLAALLFFLLHGFHPNHDKSDGAVLAIFALLLAWYSWRRIIAIAHSYDDMPDAGDGG